MTINNLRYKTFRKYFLTYMIIFMFLISAAFSIFLLVLRSERKNREELEQKEQIEKISILLDNQLSSVYNVMDIFWNTSWVNKLMETNDWFTEEFTTLRKIELSKNINSIVISNDVIKDISLIYPQKDLAINTHGWWERGEYSRYLANRLKIDSNMINSIYFEYKHEGNLYYQKLAYINTNYLIYISPLEISNIPRAFVVVTVDKDYLSKLINPIYDENMQYLELVDRELGIIYTYEGQDNSAYKESANDMMSDYTAEMPSSSLILKIGYSVSKGSIAIKDILRYGIILIIASISALFTSYYLAYLTYKPLKHVLAKINHSNKKTADENKSEYSVIEESFERLKEQNLSFQESLTKYKEAANKNLQLRLLNGYFVLGNYEREISYFDLPFSNDDTFYVIQYSWNEWSHSEIDQMYDLKTKAMAVAELIFNKEQYRAVVTDTMDNSFVVILASKIDNKYYYSQFKQLAEKTANAIFELIDVIPDYFISQGHKGMIGISIAYQKTERERLNSEKEQINSDRSKDEENHVYFPEDWKKQLKAAVYNGNENLVNSIIIQIFSSNEEQGITIQGKESLINYLIELINQLMDEWKIDPNDVIGEVEITWKDRDNINTIFHKLSKTIIRRRLGMIDHIQHPMLDYVNYNYNDPDLSLKNLSQVFELSVASVSRTFKEITNINFHEYLTRLRINKSKQLLEIHGYDLKRIVYEVGYDNEYSFKRAFLRVEGEKPRDYVEAVRDIWNK